MINNPIQNDNDQVSKAENYKWILDVSEYSITVSHQESGLTFRFSRIERNGAIADDITIVGNEDHPEFQDILNEASQIAEDTANDDVEDTVE